MTLGCTTRGNDSVEKVTVLLLVAPVATTFALPPETTAALARVSALVSVLKRHCGGVSSPLG